MLLAFAGLTTGASAQETSYPTLKHEIVTNNFWSNWFVNAGGDYTAFYSSQEAKSLDKSPLKAFRRNYGFDLSVGKWATPVFGMRVKGQAAWMTCVDGINNETRKAFNVQFQPMIQLINLFGGYKPRVYELSLYGGVGFARNCSDNNYTLMTGFGLFNQFNVTKRFHINLDLYCNIGEPDLDGINALSDKCKFLGQKDLGVGASLGVGVNLGKVGWQNAPDVDAIMAMNQAQLDALNASLADAEAENARLKALIANHKCPEATTKYITEYATTSASVFFNINQTKIASKKDLVNVKEIAEIAKSKGATVVVTGYADSKTGSVARNQTLSEGRAQTVVNELVKMGVSRDKIEVVAKGGVADLEPYNYNRRAVVTLK